MTGYEGNALGNIGNALWSTSSAMATNTAYSMGANSAIVPFSFSLQCADHYGSPARPDTSRTPSKISGNLVWLDQRVNEIRVKL